jgi:peptide/nickel transport system permease protein
MAATTGESRYRDSAVGRVLAWFASTLKLMARNKVGFAGFLVVSTIVLVTFIGPVFLPSEVPVDVNEIYETPSLSHPLGTDSEGKDVLLQIINGGRPILTVGFLAAAISTTIAVTFGSLGGFVGGRTDTGFTWLAVLAGVLSLNSKIAVAALIGVLFWPTLMRAIRAQVLSLKERDYVESARALGLGTPHIVFREIAPNMAGYIAINFTLAVTASMYAVVGLTLLGLVPLSEDNWGVMINLAWTRGAIFSKDSLFYIMSPIAAIALFQLGLVAMNRSLSEIFDPRLRRGS